MGTGYTRNDVSNNIADGNIISASDIDGEYDAIEAAFNSSTGHTHDGTAAEGGAITVVGPVQDLVVSATEVKPKTTNTLDLGTSGLLYKDAYLQGNMYFRDTALKIVSSADGQLDIDADVELELVAPTVDIDASTAVTIDTATLTVTGSANVVGDLDVDNININGNTIISTDTNGNIALTPNGTGEVDISKVDIDSGAIDGVTLGTNSAVTEAQVDNININGNTISSTDTNGNITLAPNGTGVVALSSTDLTFGDTDKALFGAGSDLQIYHDGSNSYIQDTGTGNLFIQGESAVYIRDNAGAAMAVFNDGGAVQLRYNGNEKLATTATGVDVTGTVTADGLTVDGDVSFTSNNTTDQFIIENTNTGSGSAPDMVLYRNSTSPADGDVIGRIDYRGKDDGALDRDYITLYSKIADASTGSAGGSFHIQTRTGVTTADRFVISGSGDVGIGTSSPATKLEVAGAVSSTGTGAGNAAFKLQEASNNPWYLMQFTGGAFSLNYNGTTGGASTLLVDSSGNVGIGTTSPAFVTGSGLEIERAGAATLRLEDTGSGGKPLEIYSDDGEGYVINGVSTGMPMIFKNNNAERMRIDTSGNVGIGTSSPSFNSGSGLEIQRSDTATLRVERTGATASSGEFFAGSDKVVIGSTSDTHLEFRTNNTERMRILSTGDIAFGNTAANTVSGYNNQPGGGYVASDTHFEFATTSNRAAVEIGKNNANDGQLVAFRKQNTTVGSIASEGGNSLIVQGGTTGGAGLHYHGNSFSIVPARNNARIDNVIDLGTATNRFDDIYATNGTIQTSDANEKQQIAALTDAEITAAKSISALFKTFKWNDAVAEKGDAARTHAGVIAQDVQAAMTAAGLDAGDYAFFISSTWWETQTEVPAVEADEENGIEAVAAYTRTDTFKTAEEAPEGATERTRLGIRYPELLAFVGAATEQRLANIETRLAALEAN